MTTAIIIVISLACIVGGVKYGIQNATIERLKSSNKGLLDALQRPVQTMQETAPDVVIDADFDIEGMQVFAVERLTEEKSNIGHLMEGKVADFSLVCTVDVHNSLVRRLREKTAKGATVVKDSVGV